MGRTILPTPNNPRPSGASNPSQVVHSSPEYPRGFDSSNNPFVGTRFSEMYENNPYNTRKVEETFWDQVSHALGFRSNYDIAEAQRLQARDDYNAQLYQLQSEDDYNSALGQSDQLAQAGRNPMLSDVGAGSAGEFAQEQTSPDYSGLGETPSISSVSQGLIGVVQSAFGFYKQALDLGILKKDSQIKDFDVFGSWLKNKNDLTTAAANWLLHSVDDDLLKSFIDNPDGETWENVLNSAVVSSDSDDFSSKFGRTLEQFKKSSWIKNEVWKMARETQESRLGTGRASAWSNGANSDDISEVVSAITEFLSDEVKAYSSRSHFDSGYWSKRNGSLTAESDESSFGLQSFFGESGKEIKENFDKLVDKIAGMGNHGNLFASIFVMFVPLLMQSMMKR